MKVWVVLNGEQCEGGRVCGVFSSKENAVTFALSVKCHFGGGWKPAGENNWENGCDYVCVEEWSVQP